MTVITYDELNDTLDLHKKWLNGKEGGKRANLSGRILTGASHLQGAGAVLEAAILRGTNLVGINLSGINLSGADLSGANLQYANLEEANLTAANLRRVDLTHSNLTGANLDDIASMWDAVGNGKEIKSLQLGAYNTTFTDKMLQIGCQLHPIEEWRNFSDEKIEQMDGATALKFWKKYKSLIFQIIDCK